MSRRLTKQQKRLLEVRREEQLKTLETDNNHFKARVVSQHGAHLTIEDEQYQLLKASVRQNLGAIVCGDYVYCTYEQEEAVVTTRLPRTNSISRLAFGGKEQIVATNLDQIFIVMAPQPEPVPSLIDRYFIATQYFNLHTTFIINKSDLLTDRNDLSFLEDFRKLKVEILYTSIFEEKSIDNLRMAMQDKTSIFVGQSGVGKSSLVNHLIPELALQTQMINASTGLGKHTTSSTTLYHLPFEHSFLIDSPGVRSFNIEHLPPQAIDKGFPEISSLARQCKFSNCRHLQDPFCALTEKIESGDISKRRLESYLLITAHTNSTSIK